MGDSNTTALEQIEAAIAELEREREGRDDGKWLESLTVDVAPLVREWDVKRAWLFADWPQREALGYPKTDLGIDVVAERHDERFVAIQCKSRGPGGSIRADEIASFFMASANQEHWAERWLVVNRDASPNRNALSQMKQVPDHPIKPDSLHQRLVVERDSRKESEWIDAERARSQESPEWQTKDSMQAEVIDKCVKTLRNLQDEDKDGSQRGEARGRLILPCGTGKTRISLRIIERLATSRGDVSMVLCPSIALVAQIRGEYIRNHDGHVNALAVCSDQAAGDPVKNEERHAASPNPTDDSGFVSASAVKGQVTTDSTEIAGWLQKATDNNDLNVIFGTYQSAHQVASALKEVGKRLQVLVCDEAHRTAGIKAPTKEADVDALKNFTICHDSERFPANFRVYQTATPRIYDDESKRKAKEKNLHIRDMDDQSTFGPVLDRRSYQDAVRNRWLSDYKIIAIAVNDHETIQQANKLANSVKKTKGKKPKLGVTDYQKGLAFALAMAQEIQDEKGEHSDVSVKSCIAFLNTIANSKAMRDALTDRSTLEWLNQRLDRDSPNRKFVKYAMEHLDASSSLTLRDEAKAQLARGTEEYPHSVLNVGIFGEGTDSPSLSAVAFLEPRKSQVDVVQAVGRVMRTAPGKSVGYIIVPIHVPQDTPAEEWLMSSSPDEGWRELGQILRALRAHDGRIERDLPSKLKLVLPPEPDTVHTLLAVKTPEAERATKFLHTGRASDANQVAEALAKGEVEPEGAQVTPIRGVADLDKTNIEPARIVTAKVHNSDPQPDVRVNTVNPNITDRKIESAKRNKAMNEEIGNMLNRKPGKDGKPIAKKKSDSKSKKPKKQLTLFDNPDFVEFAEGIRVNLLSNSGLGESSVERDANILIGRVITASHFLAQDELKPELDSHFGIDRLNEAKGDSAKVAALILLNAAMLHQRIAAGGWLEGIRPLTELQASSDPVSEFRYEWERILRHDFQAVLGPAADVIQHIARTGKTAGLAQALRSVAESAGEIAVLYADMGTDHAGRVYNAFMADQASDGAYFTRPPAAVLLAKLALDACGNVAWGRGQKIVDPACGSGTLLAAALSEIKARQSGALPQAARGRLQRELVQNCLIGLDINEVSLQLAASQLTAGTHDVRYAKMGLRRMPYGPQENGQIRGGSMELFASEQLIPRKSDFDFRENIDAEEVWGDPGTVVEDAAELVANARLVIMNPPYSNRSKMGEKFAPEDKKALRHRMDALYGLLGGEGMGAFNVSNSVRPMFVALADCCLVEGGVMAFVCPTIALTNPSALDERVELAKKYHVHAILVSSQKANRNMSAETSIDESLVILKKKAQEAQKQSTLIIVLDRFPRNEDEATALHQEIVNLNGDGILPNGLGQVSSWPESRINAGNWAPTTLHSPELREAALQYAKGLDGTLRPLSPSYGMAESRGGREDASLNMAKPQRRHMPRASGLALRASYQRRTKKD